MSNKINIVRSMKTKNYYNNDPVYVKEVGWDDRFHLGKLPKYEAEKELSSNISFAIFKLINFIISNKKSKTFRFYLMHH